MPRSASRRSQADHFRALGACGVLLAFLALGCASPAGPGDEPRNETAATLAEPAESATPPATAPADPAEETAGADPSPEAPFPEIQAGATSDYDFLVGRDHELAGRLDAALDAYIRAAEKDPESAYLQRKVGALAWRNGELDRALAHAERAVDLAPEEPDGRVFLGQIYRLRKQNPEAIAVLSTETGSPVSQEAALLLYGIYLDGQELASALSVAEWMVADDPENLRAYFALSRAHAELDQPQEAIAALRSALDQAPGSLSVYAALAQLYRDRADRDAEIATYREMLEEYPHHRGTLSALVDALIATSRSEEARVALEELVVHHPSDVRAVIRLALLEFDAGEYASAADRFEKSLADNPEDYELAYFLGILRQRMSEFEAARLAFAMVPEHHDRYADARSQIATLYEREGDFPQALEEARIALRVAPSSPLELYVARLRAKNGDLEGAVGMLEARLAETPDDDELLYNIGLLYGEAKRFEESLQYMHRALEKNPDNASALNYIGYTWAERGERLDEAEVLIVRARELRPDDGYITDSLAWVYYMRAVPLLNGEEDAKGRALLRDALRTLEEAAELTGGDPVISEHLGDVLLLLEDKHRALESYRDAVEQSPREGEQPDLQDKLDTLQQELEAQ